MRYITINLGCDWEGCEALAEEGDGTVVPTTLALDNRKPKESLLCKTHKEELEELLLPLMAKGVTIEKPEKTTRSTRASAAASAAGAAAGATKAAETSMTSGSANGSSSSSSDPRYLAPLPVDTAVPDTLRCKEDGCGRPFRNRAGFAVHVYRTHNYENLAAYEAVHDVVVGSDVPGATVSSSSSGKRRRTSRRSG